MSYTRKFKRNYDKVNDIAAEQPKSSVTLSQRIVAAVTAAGFVLNPMAVFASTIIKADQSLQNTVVTNGNVTQVWADKVVGNAAVNVFDQYKVNAGHIANMYFKELNGKVEAQNLVNFVNSRIDVNGTVNAIQNSKIGGNMFFLSKDGMAVGKSGVINTGSLYVMTPTDAFMNNIIGADGRNFNEDNFKAQWGDGINGNITKMQIPVNASGTITVLGNINAANDVKMMAANISVGRNNTEAAIDGVAADGIVKEATIQTGVSDFSNIVNITDANGKVIVNAGLADNLTATVDKNSGDIVLRAVASDVNSNDSKFAEYKGSDNQAKATVVVDGKVTAAKDVTITAAAVNGAGNEKIFNDKYVQVEGDDSFTEVYGQLRKNVATVDINGEVTGKHVDIQANTINNYISRTDDDTRLDLLTGLAGVITVNEAAAYGVLANEATVNINKGAVITATAKADGKKALNISAESKLNASVGATTAAFKLANVKHTGNVPSAAVTYAQTDNKAAVNINAGSTLKSNGNTNISANADSTLDANAINKTTQLDGDPTLVNLGLLIATGKNASEVNIQKGAALTGTETAGINGDLTVKATSTNSVNTSALAAGKEASVASTAINVTKYDSSANVNIDADLTADNITASANNLVTKNNVTADNSVGANMLKSLVTQKVGSTKTVSDVKAFGSELKKKFFGGMGGGGSTAFDKVGEMIGVGASVSVAQESNTARVKIGSGAQITAQNGSGTKGDVNITANNIIADTQMGATGISSNYNKDSNQKAIINASVLYADMNNDATVEVSGTNEKGEGTNLTGKNVSVTATSEFQYNRVERMINDLLALCKKLENAYASNETYKKNVQELQKLAEDYKKNAAGNPDYLNSDDGLTKAAALATAAGTVGANASDGSVQSQIKDIVTGPYNVLGAVVQFANPDNYVNFRTGSSTGGKDDGAKASVAGSANVTYLTNNSSVLIGKNTVIDAAEAADLKANVAQKDVSLVGKLLTGGGDTSVGGNVNLYFGDTNSLIVVGEGAKINGGAINITSDNDINHTGVTYGAGKGGEAGVTGMVNVMQGDSNSLISIDDEATLTATGTETYDKDKDKVDTITGKKDGKINIKSTNNTTITNVAGTAAMADTAAVGIGVAVNMYNVNNKIAIADNDIDNSSDDEDKKAVAEILKANLSEKEREAVLGTAGVDKKADAEISGRGLEVNAASGGTINAVGVAGSAVMGSDYDEPGIGDKFNNFKKNLQQKGEGAIGAIDGKIQGLFKEGGVIDGVGNASQGTSIPTNPNAGQKLPSFTVSGAGSNATNIIDGDTSSVIDGVTINMKDQGAVKAGAVDDSFVGAWAGSAAVNWKTTVTQQNWNNKSVGIAGAVAVNQADVDVKSIIKNAAINDAGNITNTAEKNGALVAAGIGGNFSKDASGGGGKKYTGAASVSVNLSENNVEAALENNTVANEKGKTNLTNDAYNNDTQVTGGVNANLTFGGDNANSIGAAVSVADITNTVTSKISGGTYTNMGDMAVNAVTDITQVGAAVGIGVSTAQDGNNLQGNAAYNKLTNNVTALVDGGAKITTDSIAVKAYDTDAGEKKHDAYINARGLDATGAEYQKNVSDAGYEDGDEIFNADGSVKAGQTGNKIITAALSIAGSANKGNSGAAAVSINDINNDFTARVNGATITANGNAKAGEADVDVHASSNTLMVNVAAGGAGTSQGFGGAGSVSWQTLNNDITAAIENSTITAGKTAVNAASGALGVNVAGQVAVGKNAAGLALAYNAVENNTGAYVKGSEIKNDNDEETELAVKAVNTGKIYAVGAGVTAATEKIALNGSIAINRGNNNVEAIIDDYTDEKIKDKHTVITNAQKVDVATNDSSTSLAVVGGVTVGKKAAAGGAVAYNEIGNISGSGDGKVQNNTAQIKNAQITAVKDAQISVNADDTAKLTTAAVGVGVTTGGGAAVQGAAATALINKNTVADMTGVTIKKAKDKENGADVTVHASSDNDILTTADVASVAAGGNGAAIGAGVAVNRSEANVTASVNGGQQNVNNLRVDAANNAAIETIGVGGSVAGGTGAGITGSVAVNQIGNNTTAKIAGGANITADNNVIVDAISDEQIANYAGALSVAAKGAAVGVSVSVNQIDSTTNAAIGDEKDTEKTSVTALGKGDKDKVEDEIAKGDILDAMASEDIFKSNDSLGKHRTDSEYSGIAVSASSTHDIKSFLVNAGVAGQGAAVNGTVNVNQIGGVTTAVVKNAKLISEKDINVAAHDYSNSAGLVGTASVAGQGAGIGMGSDTALIDGAANAVVDDSELTADEKLVIDAASKQGIASLTVGAAVAGMGAGVAGVVTVTQLENVTKAQLTNSKVTAGSLDVTADHYAATNAGNVGAAVGGIGAGVGLSVGVLKDNSTTEVTVGNDESDDKAENTITVNGDVNIKANNLTKVAPTISATGVGGVGAGVAGATSVNNINSTVKTNINNVAITSENGSIAADAHNEFTVDAYVGGNAAGAVGVGASVTVNTIDSTVQTNVDNSDLKAAKDIELTASEKRTITQLATNAAAGAAAAGANIAITNVGKKIDTSNENGKAVEDAVNQANGVYGDFDLGDYTYGKTTNAQPSVGAELGGDKDSQITVNVNGGKLAAGNDVTAKAEEFDNITMTLGSGAVGGAAVNAGVGILDVNRNVGVNITGAAVTAGNAIDLGTKISGSSELNIYQGTAGLIGVNGAYGEANSSGTSQVTINGGNFTGKNIAVNAIDAGRTSVEAIGITAGVVGVGGIVANGSNTSETTITVNNTSMTANDENIDIHAERKARDENGKDTASLDINAIAGSGGLLGAGAGLGALANEMGKVGVIIGSDNISGNISGNSLTAAKKVNITALNAPVVNVSTTSAAGSLVASAAVTYAKANIGSENNHMETYVTVGEGNTFAAGSGEDDGINIEAKADADQTVDMKAVSVAIGGAGQANAGEANVYSDVTVNIADKNTYTTFDKAKADEKVKAVDVNINGVNNVMQNVNAEGTAAGGYFASGTNLAWTDTHLVTNVSANGSTENSAIGDLTVKASSKADSTVSSDGSGGALVDISPYAARSENNIDSETNVNIAGNWNIAGNMKAEALHENAVKLTTDAVKASAVGLSGVHSDNTITNATSVNYDKATVTTGGDQDITARNTIYYTNDTEGSGYGVAQGAAVWAEDDMDLTANVNITESTIKAKGAITAEALTGDAEYNSIGKPTSSVNKEVTIKSAGVVAGTYAESTDDIDFTNTVNVGAGSTIATIGTNKNNADITLTAADRTNYINVTTADTQGGVVGAAGTKLTNNIDRNNTITIAGTVDSNYDANLDAGDSSKLNLTLKSNAYNKTAAPIATVPSISGKMNQTSTIDIQSGSTIRSLRDINVAAGVGDTTIAKESKTWRWVDGGETGTGSIASTSDGTFNDADGKLTTSVTVDGTLEAGKNHELDITIDYNKDGSKNLEDALKKYGDEKLGLGDLEEELKKAQSAYDNREAVKNMQADQKALNEAEDTKANHTLLKKQYETEKGYIETNVQKAETAVTTAKEAKDSWLEKSCNEYNAGLAAGAEKVKLEDFINGLTDENKKGDWYDTYIKGYKEKLKAETDADNVLQEYKKDLTAKTEQIANYATLISNLSSKIETLKENIAGYKQQSEAERNALQECINAYDEALKKGLNTDTVNAFVFKGQKGDKEGDYVSVTAPKWFTDLYGSPAEKIGMADYAASLTNRMEKLIGMAQEYAGTDVGKAYSAELQRVQSELQALGLLTKDSQGNLGLAEGASTVPTIELQDIMVSGGNVNISGGSLEGEGAITAHGNPYVNIENKTDLFLHVNNVTVESDGGNVRFNEAGINGNKYNGIGITAEKTDTTGSGNNAQITIHNSSQTKASENQIYTPDIGIYGTVSNPFGNIEITNDLNSIYIAGEVKDDDGKMEQLAQKAGSITGRTVNLTAGGAVTQGYSDGITDVAGDPKKALNANYISAIQQALISKLTDKTSEGKYYAAFNSVDELATFLTGLTVEGKELSAEDAKAAAKILTGQVENNDKPGIAAGGAVYINAASINVNGTIQSGYEDIKLDIDQDRAKELMQKTGYTGSKDEDFKNPDWLLTKDDSGAVYDEATGKFVYNVRAWYNPETKQIFTEDIEQAGGGRIYLTGAIANTNANGGKLVVLDGGSKYDIDGSVKGNNNFTFKLGSINAATVDGRIEITDTNEGDGRTVVYTRKETFTLDKDGNRIQNNDKVTNGFYNPKTGQFYNWSNGTANTVINSYKNVTDTSWFGLSSKDWQDLINSLDEETKNEMLEGSVPLKDEPLKNSGNIINDGSTSGYDKLAGSDKNANTIYQILMERKGKPKQMTDADGKLLYLAKDKDGNDVTTTTKTDRPYYMTTKNDKGETVYVYETVISDKVTTTKKKGLLGLWGKTVTTTWKETQGMLTAYNFGLKADNKIGIEFTGNANGSTGTITSNGNILLGGDIHMGQIDITSTGGSISHLGDAAVVSDNAKFNANTGIDVIQKNVKDNLHLNAVTNTGNINIKAIAANANSDVYIDNVKTGGKGTKQGAVNITAEGSILNGTGDGAHVTGDSITLRSYNGSIGADKDNMLIIDGGEAGTNAYAAKNINITEANGNMYLGEIVAENGDVVLEVKESGAGFVDAIVDNHKADTDNRLDEWKKLGLLGGDSEAANSQDNQKAGLTGTAENGSLFLDEKTNLAEAQKKGQELLAAGETFVEMMKGGSQAVQDSRKEMNAAKGKLNEAIAKLDDSDVSKAAYKNALEAYNAAYEKYAEAGAAYDKAKDEFIANSGFAENERAAQWLKSYEAVGNADTDNYGWTENQLLYAVQDSVINPTAGGSIGDVQTANVTGNNITFISDTGNIGVVDDQTTIIATKKLSGMFTRKGDLTADEQAKLEKLAGARAGDVTWGDENITIKRTTPVSVKLNGNSDGKVTVKNTSGATADHIYLLAKDSRLTADEFAANDLRLSGQQGLDIDKVTGEKIYLEGGSGDIGSGYGEALKDMQVTLNNGGYVNANAAGNIKLSQAGTGNFTIGSIAGENVDITANGSIVSKSDDIGYINAGDTINLISKEGGVGSADAGLRIKNSGAVVNTNVQGAVNIEAKQDGTLVLGAIKQTDGGVNVESEGSILVGRTDDTTTTDKDESVEGYIDSKGDVNLHADENIEINGKLHVNGGEGSLKLHADNGNITQTATSAEKNIETGRLDMAAVGGSIDLGNKHNVIGKVDIHGLGGGMNLNVSNKGLEIDLGGVDNKLGGDVHIGNETGDVHITTNDITKDGAQDEANINGNLYVKAQGSGSDIENSGVLNVTGTLEFNAKDGSITSNIVSGKDVIMNAITQELEKITAKNSVSFTGDKIHAGTVEQDKSAAGNLTINTDSSSGGAIGSINIDKLTANDKSIFTDLWTETAKINTPNSKIDFNKLNVENKVQITTSETSVNVHGPKPGAKDPSADVELWRPRPQNMFVNIDGKVVTTNADILSLKDYYYVYDQRFTVENYMRFMLNDTIEDVYDIEGDYTLVYYNRYYNYDLPEMAQNADEDELVIESEKV